MTFPSRLDADDLTPPVWRLGRRRRDASVRWTIGFAGLAFAIVIALHAGGVTSSWTFPLVTFAGVVCGVYGLWKHQHTVLWPWASFVASGILLTVAGIVRESTMATGDLTRSRSLLPDLFALPAYVIYGVGLWSLLRRSARQSERDVVIDGLMLVAGAALLVHELLVRPALADDDTWIMARLAIIVYPAVSTLIVMIAARLAFGGDARSPAFVLMVFGTFSLLVGDVVFAAGELALIDVPGRLVDVPYLVVPASMGISLLHPSAKQLVRTSRESDRPLEQSRHFLVACALFAPIGVLMLDGVSQTELMSIALCVTLAVLAVVRIVVAMQAQADSKSLLAHRATHDELTGLPGRTIATQTIDDVLAANGDVVAVMFIDLDRFKLINDSMGHAAGDELLCLVADRFRAFLPDDVVVSRVSGDEFLVIAPGYDESQASDLGERLRSVLSERFVLRGDVEVFAAASIGITVGRGDEPTDAGTLLREADAAMYRSKAAGRNQTTMFDVEMREQIEQRVELERALRTAIHDGGLSVAYQPIVHWPSGQVLGLEALARWTHDGNDVVPTEFIEVAEDSGLIVPLGTFVLDEALRQTAWLRRHVRGCQDLYVSVNLSPVQLQAGDIVDVIADALAAHRLPGSALSLEITEGVMMEDPIAAVASMNAIGALGVGLAVDDFGTGFSSLSYLKRFPIDVVKIDRSFVSGLGSNDADESLVRAIVSMTDALSLATIAEGVEEIEQARHLAEIGCTRMQGFLFSKAVPIAELPDVLERLSGHHTTLPPRRPCATVMVDPA